MRRFFKTLFSPRSLNPEKSLSRPIPPNLSNPKPKPTPSNLSPKFFDPKNYPLGPHIPNPPNFFTKNRRQRTKDDPEPKLYWLERWHRFRDKRLIQPFERFIYMNLVLLGIIKKLLLKHPNLLSATLRAENWLDRLQRNPKARVLFLPGVMLVTSLLVSGSFVRII